MGRAMLKEKKPENVKLEDRAKNQLPDSPSDEELVAEYLRVIQKLNRLSGHAFYDGLASARRKFE